MLQFIQRLAAICLSALVFVCVVDAENVVSTKCVRSYKLKAGSDGKLKEVKTTDEITYLSQYIDEEAISFVGYGDFITIDKASAPGAKPIYAPMRDDDIFFADSRICLMNIPLKAGKEAKAVFNRTIKDPAQFCEIMFSTIYDTEVYTVSIEVPAELAKSIKIEDFDFPADALKERHESGKGDVTYTYTIHNLAKPAPQPLAPSLAKRQPRLLVSGHFTGLADLYAYLHSYMPDTGTVHPDIASKAKEITDGCTTDIGKIENIADWVQNNIRYVAIEHGEYGRRPDDAVEVLNKKYGDCKGSANLACQLMRASGIDSHLVWIGTRNEIPYSWSEHPTMASGNHMIAAALLADTIIYVDGTCAYAPLGFLPESLQGREALIENGANFLLRKVPVTPTTQNTGTLLISATITNDLRLKTEERHIYGGQYAAMVAKAYHEITGSKRDNMLHRLALAKRKDASVENVKIILDNPYTTIIQSQMNDGASLRRVGERIIIEPPLPDCEFLRVVDTEKRTAPVELPYRCNYHTELCVDLGEIAQGREVVLPDNNVFDSDWFSGGASYLLDGNKLKITYDLATKALIANSDQIEAWNKQVRDINKIFKNTVLIK